MESTGAPSTLDQALADDPSWDAEENDLAAQLDQNAESTFQTTLDQAQSFDDILNDDE
jgi:hypothetical protein